MTDQLISEKTLNLAKEKGFTWAPYAKQPTQSLLQKWLREVHNLYVAVPYIWAYKIFNIQKDNDEDLGNSIISYASYEEALEAGLIEALKLIS